MKQPRQGDIWVANLSPIVGTEQAGVRPVVIVASDHYMRMPIEMTIVVPITSRDRRLPNHVAVVDDGGLDRPSWAMTEAVRAISVRRLHTRLGAATHETLTAIADHIGRWLEVPAPDENPQG